MATNHSLEFTSTTRVRSSDIHSIDDNQSFQLFPRLPAEIRQLVWFFTFSPRIVQIQVHEESAPHLPKLATIDFTASEDLIAIPPTYVSPDYDPSIVIGHGDYQPIPGYFPSPALSRPYPRGPAALYVCRESREVALRHYELAFGSVNLQPGVEIKFPRARWKAGSAEKKIWINFKLDLITVLDHANHSGIHLPARLHHPIYYMTQYARAETKKIQRLAVSECWYPGSHPDRVEPHPTHGPGYFDPDIGSHRDSATSFLKKALKDFKAIKELQVYEIGGHQVWTHHGRVFYPRGKFPLENMGRWREMLLRAFQLEKANTPEWTADLPKITVRKGMCRPGSSWDGTFLK